MRTLSLLCLFLGILGLFASAPPRAQAQEDDKKLVAAYCAETPFIMAQGNTVVGIYADLYEEIARRMNLPLAYQSRYQGTIDGCIQLIGKGYADIIAGVPEKWTHDSMVVPLAPPIRDSVTIAFYTSVASGRSVASFSDLVSGPTLCVVDGTLPKRLEDDSSIERNTGRDVADCMERLSQGYVDVVAADQVVGDYLVTSQGLTGSVRRNPFTMTDDSGRYMALSAASPYAERADDFSRVLKDMADDGTILQIFRLWK